MKLTRQEQILRFLSETGALRVEEAVTRIEASPATIRRDFNQMAEAGLVERIHGGIKLVNQIDPLPFRAREVKNSGQKLEIARRATTLLSEGDVVFVDGGTTTLQLADCLPPIKLRIITNSLTLAAAIERRMLGRGPWEVFLTGGYLFPGTGLLVGPSAQYSIEQYHADWALLSAGGITETGIFNDNEHVVESERLMIKHADRVAVLADESKFGRHAMRHIANLDQLDYLVSNQRTQDSRPFENHEGIKLKIIYTS
ncbi:DeoR/GlpR family DNA-binding transcription regulator [Bremerella alba]|uniref:Glycerol-3-phosphate regulon repressor n=1 Tax=Bremerella alba TaxID=980252 RepID=A0A7V8V9D1_9BACT|nr:DeoR/GlpR family DNA-binding transcription regulator [Bremerella alba]MBA2117333.1 Glycerol-3-phosphate regulon repressor [Bremerella alba]